MGRPVLVFEPSKGEYRRLLRRLPREEVRVFTPGNGRLSPLRFNPLEVPPRVTVGEHATAVADAISSVVDSTGPIGPLVTRTIIQCYLERGLDLDAEGRECTSFPTLFDAMDILPSVMEEQGYSASTRSDVEGAIAVRLGALIEGPQGRIFASRRSHPSLEDLIEHATVLELQALGPSVRTLFILFYLVSLVGVIRGRGPGASPCLFVLEEAHGVIGSRQGVRADAPDPGGAVTDLFYKIIAEFRAYGIGVVIVDQTPAAIPDLVRKNTLTKIVHRPADGEDAGLLASDLNLSGYRVPELKELRCGQVFLYHESLHAPVRVQVAAHPEYFEDMLDDELRTALRCAPWYPIHLARVLDADLQAILRLASRVLAGVVTGVVRSPEDPLRSAIERMNCLTNRAITLGLPKSVARRILAVHQRRLRDMVRATLQMPETA